MTRMLPGGVGQFEGELHAGHAGAGDVDQQLEDVLVGDDAHQLVVFGDYRRAAEPFVHHEDGRLFHAVPGLDSDRLGGHNVPGLELCQKVLHFMHFQRRGLEGDAPLTSLSEMMPTTRFWSSTTGRRRIWCSLSRLRHFSRDVSGLTAMTLVAIQFSTSMDPPVEQRPCGMPRAGTFPFLSCPFTLYQAAPTNKPVGRRGSADFHDGAISDAASFS